MIGRWLIRRREKALEEFTYSAKLARLLSGSPIGVHADADVLRRRRRLARADFALDTWNVGRR